MSGEAATEYMAKAQSLIEQRKNISRLICSREAVDDQDGTCVSELKILTQTFVALLPLLLKNAATAEKREELSLELLQFKKWEWLCAIDVQFKKTFHPALADIIRLNRVLGRLLMTTNGHLCEAKQEEFGASMFFSSSAFSPLLSKLLTLAIKSETVYAEPAMNFATAFFGYIFMHQLAARKAPGVDEILRQPHLALTNFIAKMKTYTSKEALLEDLELKVSQAEIRMSSQDSRWTLLYNALVCGVHAASASTVTQAFSDALQLVGATASWCSRGVDSALGWIGLKSVATATTNWLGKFISETGLDSVANLMTRIQFMRHSQITVDASLAELKKPLHTSCPASTAS